VILHGLAFRRFFKRFVGYRNNDYDSIFIEKVGKISKTNVAFADEKKSKTL
jgi:hypothetical protein